MEFIYLFLGAIGLCVGSFANVLIDRLPKGKTVIYGRSHCDFCGKKLEWYELIPVFSYLLQGGRCRRCRRSLSVQYPLIELTTAVGFMLIYPAFASQTLLLLGYYLVFISLLVIFVADFKYQIIPDSMVVLGMIGAAFVVGLKTDNLLTGVVSALFFLFLYLVTRGRGMGFGDVKFALLMGYLAGFPKIIVAFYVAFLTGAVMGVILILGGKKKLKSKISFGPFLVLGLVVSLIWGDKLSLWILKII